MVCPLVGNWGTREKELGGKKNGVIVSGFTGGVNGGVIGGRLSGGIRRGGVMAFTGWVFADCFFTGWFFTGCGTKARVTKICSSANNTARVLLPTKPSGFN